MNVPTEVARVGIPTAVGRFDVRAFRGRLGLVYLLMCTGDLGGGGSVLTRLHSECLTGDALGSLRCDCGIQLQLALRSIAAEGRGALLYTTGDEGRGIGLVNKLRAYVLQDGGLDTVDANRHLGLPVDGRDHGEAARVLLAAGIRSIRLLTNNPDKARALREAGVEVESILPLRVAPHARNISYLRTKGRRLGHLDPEGQALPAVGPQPKDVTSLLGRVRPRPGRPYVVLKYAQSLDGRIATSGGDSRWISGEEERRVSHSLRSACDAVLVGSGTVRKDDPRLTVRMVPGVSPIRVVLDSRLALPPSSRVLDGTVPTIVLTATGPQPRRVAALRNRGVLVREVRAGPLGLDLPHALADLRALGIESLLVEGGARVITSLLREGLADRAIVGIAPKLIGKGTEAVDDLGVTTVAQSITLVDTAVHPLGRDVVMAGDLRSSTGAGGVAAAIPRSAAR